MSSRLFRALRWLRELAGLEEEDYLRKKAEIVDCHGKNSLHSLSESSTDVNPLCLVSPTLSMFAVMISLHSLGSLSSITIHRQTHIQTDKQIDRRTNRI